MCVTVCGCDLQTYLHDRVVSRNVDREQVEIPGGEDNRKQHLRLPRDACNGNKMREIKSEDETQKLNVSFFFFFLLQLSCAALSL